MHLFCLRHGSQILSGLQCLLSCIVAEKNQQRKCVDYIGVYRMTMPSAKLKSLSEWAAQVVEVL